MEDELVMELETASGVAYSVEDGLEKWYSCFPKLVPACQEHLAANTW